MTIKIYNKKLNEHDLMDAWKAGNDAGDGYAIGDDDQTPQQAIEATDTMTHCGDISPDGTAVASDHGKIIVVADANGPWAVDVTKMFDDYGDLIS